MFIKTLGLVVIFFSCFYIGNILGNRYKKRYKQLLAFLEFIEYFETEITYTSTPVIDIFDSIKEKFKWPINNIIEEVLIKLSDFGYRPLSEVWEEVLIMNKDNLALNQEDNELLIYFGNILGTTDTENQKKYFKVIKSRLNSQVHEANKHKDKYTKLFNELGIIIGLFLVILII